MGSGNYLDDEELDEDEHISKYDCIVGGSTDEEHEKGILMMNMVTVMMATVVNLMWIVSNYVICFQDLDSDDEFNKYI